MNNEELSQNNFKSQLQEPSYSVYLTYTEDESTKEFDCNIRLDSITFRHKQDKTFLKTLDPTNLAWFAKKIGPEVITVGLMDGK